MADDLGHRNVLAGCSVHVWQRVDGDVSTTQAINAKLRALGAKTLPRLTKDVTHVIFQRKLQSTAQERNAEDGDLRTIYSKVGKYEPRVFVVSPLWLHHCEDTGTRAKEIKYLERKPADPIFLIASPNKTASAGAKRKRKSLARPRELVETADVHDALFSSSQQIRDLSADEPAAPLYIRPMLDGPFASSAGGAAEGRGGGAGVGARRGASGLGKPAGEGAARAGAATSERNRATALSDVEEEDEEDCPRPAKAPSLASILGAAKQRALPGAAPAGSVLPLAVKAATKAAGTSGRPGPMAPPRPPGPASMVAGKGLRQGTLNFSFVPKASQPPQQQQQQQPAQQAAKEMPPSGPLKVQGIAGHGDWPQAQQRQAGGSVTAAAGPSNTPVLRAGAQIHSASSIALGASLGNTSVAPAATLVLKPAVYNKQQDASGNAQERPLPIPHQQEQQREQQQQMHQLEPGSTADAYAATRDPGAATGAPQPAVQEVAAVSARKRPHQHTPLSPNLMPRSRRQSATAAAASTAAPVGGEDPTAASAARYSPLPCAVVPRGAPSAAAVASAEEVASTAVRLGQAAVPIAANGGAATGSVAAVAAPGPLPPRAKNVGRRSTVAQDAAAVPGPSSSLPAAGMAAPAGSAGPVALSSAVAAALAAAPGGRPGSAGRRAARASCAGTPLGGSVALAMQSAGKLGRPGMRTPLGGTPGPFGFTPLGTMTVPRLKSQSSGGYGSSQSASATPELTHGLPAAPAGAAPDAAAHEAGAASAVREGAEGTAVQQPQEQQQREEAVALTVQPPLTTGTRRTTRRSGLPPTPPMSSHRNPLTPPPLTLVPVPVTLGGGAGALEAAGAGGVTPTLVHGGRKTSVQSAAPPPPPADDGGGQAGPSAALPPPPRTRATPKRGALVLERLPAAGRSAQEAVAVMAAANTSLGLPIAVEGAEACVDAEAELAAARTGRRSARKAAAPVLLPPVAALGPRVQAAAGGDVAMARAALPDEALPLPLLLPPEEAPGSVVRRSQRLVSASPLPPRPPSSALKASAAAPPAADAAGPGASLAFGLFTAHQQLQRTVGGVLPALQAEAASAAEQPGPSLQAQQQSAGPQRVPPAGDGRTPGASQKRRRPAEAGDDVDEQGAGPGTSHKAAAVVLSPAPRTRAQSRAAAGASPAPSLAPSLAPPQQTGAVPLATAPALAPAPGPQPGSPASPPRGAVRPAASHISGTPLTSPKYYTRMQRKRFSRLGVDLERLPPGQPFTLQPDGTVTVEAEAAAEAEAAGAGAGAGMGADTAGTAAAAGPAEGGVGIVVGAPGAAVAEAGAAGAALGTGCKGAAAPSPGPPASATRSRRRALDWELARAGAGEEAAAAPAAAGAGGSASAAGAAAAVRMPMPMPMPMPLQASVAAADCATACRATGAQAPRCQAAPLHAVREEAEGEGEDACAALSQEEEEEEGGAVQEGPEQQGGGGGLRPTRLRHAGSTPGPAVAAAGASRRARRTPTGGARGASSSAQKGSGGVEAEPMGEATAAGAAAVSSSAAAAPPPQRGRLSLRKAAAPTAGPGPHSSKAVPVASTETGAAELTASVGTATGMPAPSVAAARNTPAGRPPAPKPATGRKRPAAAAAAGEDQAPASPTAAAAATGAKRRRTMPAPASTAPLLPPAGAAGAAKVALATTVKTARGAAGAAGSDTPTPATTGLEATAAAAAAAAAAKGAAKPAAGKAAGSTASGVKRPRASATKAGNATALTTGALLGSAAFNSAIFMDGIASAFPSASTVSAGASSGQAAAAAAAAAGAGAAGAPALGQYPRGKGHPMRAGVRYLAHTSVEPAVAAAVSAAVRQLGGARLCTPGYEDGHVTHLVVGVPDRRTVKVLLGVANGAVFVSPAWVTQSLAAGRWLPERDYPVPGPFAATADAVRMQLQQRAQHEQQDAAPAAAAAAGASAPRSPRAGVTAKPLGGRLVAVHNAQCNGPRLAEAQARKTDVEKLVVALGGRVVPVRSATLMIMVGGGGEVHQGGRGGGGAAAAGAGAAAAERRPRLGGVTGPSSMVVASEEWLMRIAETHVWQEPAQAH